MRKDNKEKHPLSDYLPSFNPLVLNSARCTPQGRPLYYHFRNMSEHKPIQFFKKFISTNMLKTIATNTNAYAKRKNLETVGNVRISRSEIYNAFSAFP